MLKPVRIVCHTSDYFPNRQYPVSRTDIFDLHPTPNASVTHYPNPICAET